MQEKLENTNILKNSLTLKQSLKPVMVTKVPKVSSLPIDNWNVKVHTPLSENKKKNAYYFLLCMYSKNIYILNFKVNHYSRVRMLKADLVRSAYFFFSL